MGKFSKMTAGKVGLTGGLVVALVIFVSLFLYWNFNLAGAEDSPVIKVFFSPEDDSAKEITARFRRAQDSIDAAVYYFTSRSLSQALVEAMQRGIKVRVFLDEKQRTEKYSKARFLENNGVTLKFESGVGLMHNKFAVIDNKIVITGSYNWTASAENKNDENLLIIKSEPLARKYAAYFLKLWEGKVPDEKAFKPQKLYFN